ncbi:Rho GTPase activation protein [Zychaea mexicana]|uniref:Rho GTPase activation protein n=1 Tax=Zychaea mexicana TaxID=64656 RepID=UPI0022FEF4C1|nr:Rho GTPase activation protein [Zychaea mexicana]KAI9495927.1 Rho GTPase activation protein [Zychaea mexicana]
MAPSSPDSVPLSTTSSDDNDSGNDRFARLMRDTRTKMEAKKLELNATMQEKLPEWKLRGALYSQYARETGIEWSRKGKEAVDRWKKELAERDSSNAPALPTRPNSTTTLGLVFGVPLEQAVPLDGGLPPLVNQCVDYLDMHGVREVGLYRIPGSLTAVNKLRAVFDTVPEPIIPPDMYPKLNDDDTDDVDDAITAAGLQTVKTLTTQLPTHNQQLLRRLCRHLKNVADHSDINRMPTSNLAVVFIPTLGIDRTLFHCLVDHYRDIFPSPPVPSKPRHFKSKTLPDSQVMRVPPAKPSRSHIKPSSSSSLQHKAQAPPTHHSSAPAPVEPTKPRSKSMSSSFSQAPFVASWKRTTGTRVEALGRQFEAKRNP